MSKIKPVRFSTSLLLALPRRLLPPEISYRSEFSPSQTQTLKAKNTPSNKHGKFEVIEDYKLPMISRKSTASSFSRFTVFPGGVVDNADSNPKWLEQLENFRTQSFTPPPSCFAGLCDQSATKWYAAKDQLSTLDVLRLAAIRETFEETGILLARDCEASSEISSHTPASLVDGDVLRRIRQENWQRRVSHDAHEFLRMCTRFSLRPSLSALHSFAVWTTPASQPSRFTTLFFLCSAASTSSSGNDDCLFSFNREENESLHFVTPREALFSSSDEAGANAFSLMPPQIVELSRLLTLPGLTDLQKYLLAALQDSTAFPAEVFPKIIKLKNVSASHSPNKFVSVFNADCRYETLRCGDTMLETEFESEMQRLLAQKQPISCVEYREAGTRDGFFRTILEMPDTEHSGELRPVSLQSNNTTHCSSNKTG